MSGTRLLADYLAVIQQAGHGAGDAQPALRRGQFHDVVLVDDVAYRFPRDEESRRAQSSQVALLQVLGDRELPVAIPRPLAVPGDGEPLGRCHVALTRLRGQPLERERATTPRSEPVVIGELARLLGALSTLGADAAVGRAVPGVDRHRWTRFADQAARVLFPLMSDRGRQRATAELAHVAGVEPAGTALVHGDLGGSNLLWTGTGPDLRLAGVLDWDEAHLGSQAEDLASLAAAFGWPLARRLDASRHAGSCPTLPDARVIAATFALQQALPAALSGDSGSLADGLSPYAG